MSAREFITRWEMVIHLIIVTLFGFIAVALIVLAPGISNTRIAQLVALGTFLTAVTAMIAAIKTRGK